LAAVRVLLVEARLRSVSWFWTNWSVLLLVVSPDASPKSRSVEMLPSASVG
jgi:hypothetical protein